MNEPRKRVPRTPAPRNEWQTAVHVLMGHAAYLYALGQQDMPAWFYGLAEKLAKEHLDDASVQRVREVARQMQEKHAQRTTEAGSVKETGVWSPGVSNRGVFLESSDFHHDARLYVDGDFQGSEKMLYATEIATRLNAWQAADRAATARAAGVEASPSSAEGLEPRPTA